ncbi:MAG: tRNA-dihydrouridine synthase family protein [Leptospiraceae bacterium]|nr:tRNA-dihydrouridine synthase family protein [Leptospiraceae bacterium]MDW8306194.1 tRNA-dihydrouridine synthase family protein [Leptospiraceae bacterium]
MTQSLSIARGSVVLSPMAGFSDSPFRLLCRKQGSALSVTEFVSTSQLFRGSLKAFSLLRYEEAERPIIFQIFGEDPAIILRAAKKILALGPDGLDVNMGCSTRQVALRGAGAGLLREPRKVREIISSLVKECQIPISAKIRLGWDATMRNYLEIGRILQEEGAWMVAVHGRTRDMQYRGQADWEAIGELAACLKIPVFGNGDVVSFEDAQEKIRTYGVYGVYIGRSAIGRPWIFRSYEPNLNEKRRIAWEHFCLMKNFYGESATILFRKHWARYREHLDLNEEEQQEGEKLMTSTDLARWENYLYLLHVCQSRSQNPFLCVS